MSAHSGPPITSRSNPLLQRLRRLQAQPSAYRQEGLICIEGEHLCSAFLARGHRAWVAAIAESAWRRAAMRELAAGADQVHLVADRVLAQVSPLLSPAGVVFLARLPKSKPPDTAASAVLLDRLQDPGNVGSILRSASALGVRQVWATPGTAALWSPKVLRAAMGAHFGLDLCESLDVESLLPRALAQSREAAAGPDRPGSSAPSPARAAWIATSSHEGDELGRVVLPQPCVWVLGHEGQGVAEQILQRCQLTVRIPQPGGEESLNVAAAAAICLYEAHRTRRMSTEPAGRATG
ncbi:MAG: TrmH family RNA methyltransferase [Rubrivivax sp.]